MMHVEPLTAPAELCAVVRRHARAAGATIHDGPGPVKPFVQINPMPNRWTPKGQPRWVARCPECPGAEVVSDVEPFVCGSCGCRCDVDWSGT